MFSCLVKRVLPFTLALLVGAGLAAYFTRQRRLEPPATVKPNKMAVQMADDPTSPTRDLPAVHVLSVELVTENMLYADGGRKRWSSVLILDPPNSQYVPAKVTGREQGVMQLTLRFGANGEISEISPLPRAKRHDCGICLSPVGKVVYLEPNLPQSRELTEAAIEAVRRIRFIPEQSEGVPVPTHGIVECVFHLD